MTLQKRDKLRDRKACHYICFPHHKNTQECDKSSVVEVSNLTALNSQAKVDGNLWLHNLF